MPRYGPRRARPAAPRTLEVVARHEHAALAREPSSAAAIVPAIRAAAPSSPARSSAAASPGCSRRSPAAEQPCRRASRSARPRRSVIHRRDHLEARGVRRRHRDAVPREPQRGLDEPRATAAARARATERVEPGRDAGHRARRRADRVVHELRAERHVRDATSSASRGGAPSPAPRRSSRGSARRPSPRRVDRVAAAEQPRHHRLGDARREAGGDRGVRGRAAVLEDLDPGAARSPDARRRRPRSRRRSAAARPSRCARARRAGSRAGGSSAVRPRSRTRRRRPDSRASARGASRSTGSSSVTDTVRSPPTTSTRAATSSSA